MMTSTFDPQAETPVICATTLVTLEQAGALETALEMITEEDGTLPPVLTYYEVDDGKAWRLDIYFESEINSELLEEMKKRARFPDIQFDVSDVEQKDWVSETQKGLPPVIAGDFFVYGSHDQDQVPTDKIALLVDASQAFGTGHHETTSGCLELIAELKHQITPNTVADVGTGTGLLALACERLWHDAKIIASDIDPIAVEVAERTLRDNQTDIKTISDLNGGESGIAPLVATGLDHKAFDQIGPFDLITANILAAPLIALAEDIATITKEDGHVILSGLLLEQQKKVLAAYSAQGLEEVCRKEKGDWVALLLKK